MINKEMKAADLASAISVGIAAAKLTYDLSYAAGKSFYNLTH